MKVYAMCNDKNRYDTIDAFMCDIRVGDADNFEKGIVMGSSIDKCKATVKRENNGGTARGGDQVTIKQSTAIKGKVSVPYDFINGMNFTKAEFMYTEKDEEKIIPIPNYNERYIVAVSDDETATETSTGTATETVTETLIEE